MTMFSQATFSRVAQLAAGLACSLVAACSTADATDPSIGPYEAQVVDQLKLSTDGFAAKGLKLKIVGYNVADSLDSESAIADTKQVMLDGSALVPQYDGVNPDTLSLTSLERRIQAYRTGDDTLDVVANIQTLAFPSIKVGQKALDVTWEADGHQFQSKLVYDDKGVVYDNMLSNLAFVEPEAVVAEVPPAVPSDPPAAAGITPFANQSWSTRFLDYTIKWVWGSTRGKIQLDHYVISCDGWRSFCDDGYAANAWMSIGSASGQGHRNALRKPRISKLAWAYGWATPTASFSIKFSTSSLTFSASTGGVGSAGKGVGIHTII
jgi:hypothetical protein